MAAAVSGITLMSACTLMTTMMTSTGTGMLKGWTMKGHNADSGSLSELTHSLYSAKAARVTSLWMARQSQNKHPLLPLHLQGRQVRFTASAAEDGTKEDGALNAAGYAAAGWRYDSTASRSSGVDSAACAICGYLTSCHGQVGINPSNAG